jgi:hypothetical protein
MAFTKASRASITTPTIRNGIESSQRKGHAINITNANGQHKTRRSAHKSRMRSSFMSGTFGVVEPAIAECRLFGRPITAAPDVNAPVKCAPACLLLPRGFDT